MREGNEINLIEPSSNKMINIADDKVMLVDNKGKKTKKSGKESNKRFDLFPQPTQTLEQRCMDVETTFKR